MGVVFGKIQFLSCQSGYEFISNYCLEHQINLVVDSPQDRLLATEQIPQLKVFTLNGTEVKGLFNTIDGSDDEGFDVTIVGIPYPFYEQEFSQHVQQYQARFLPDE